MSKPSQNTTLLALATLVLVLGLAVGNADADTIYVCWDGSGDYRTIQEGIDAAVDGDEVVVCDGVYAGPGNKNLDFHGKAITVRSAGGDPDLCVIDCENDGRGFYFHSGETNAATLSGFTITNGYASYGGGVACLSGSDPTVANCTITANTAGADYFATGGGIHCEGSSPTIMYCTISGNSALSAYGRGGGLYNLYSSPTVVNCTFSGNWAGERGGAVCCVNSTPTVTDCTFSENTAADYGGGLYNLYSSPTVANCTFSGNISNQSGGGVQNGHSHPAIRNCMFVGNYARSRGGGMYNAYANPTVTNCTFTGNSGGGMYNYSGSPTVTNCILWGDMRYEVRNGPGVSPVITYCDIQGGWTGEGNIDADPLFAFADDYHIVASSPCVDAGTNDPPGGLPPDDFDGNPRPLDGDGDAVPVADMGVYEFNPDLPSIALSPAELEFFAQEGGSDPEAQVLSIRNCGGGTLQWEISEACDWLAVSPANGDSSGEIDEVSVRADISGLARGQYVCLMSVSDDQAPNNPRTVTVTLFVNGTFHVPDDYPTIQAAIDASLSGDLILVGDGVYTGEGNKNLDFHGKAINLRSENGPDNCIIDCEADGRGFYFHSGETETSVVDGFTITNGRASFGGGAVFCDNAAPAIINCIIAGNHAEYVAAGHGGGGILVMGNRDVTITACTIINNLADLGGGGIQCRGSNVTISNCTVTGNTADRGGGLICGGTTVMIVDCTITNNLAQDGDGGGLICGGTTVMIVDCAITDNAAPDEPASGGGVYCSDNTAATISGCTIASNTSGWEGGGVYCTENTSTTITDSTITGNLAHWPGGGGIFLDYETDVTITGCAITNNTVDDYDGGGVYCRSSRGVAITDCTITGNTTGGPGRGGGLCSYDSSISMTNCTVSGNAANYTGGGIRSIGHDPGQDRLTLTGCTVAENAADYEGGGICAGCTGLTLIGCTITQNTGGDGGGIFSFDSNVVIALCKITNNTARMSGPYFDLGGGGIFCKDNHSATIIGCLIAGNTAGQNGGGLLCYRNNAVTITACTIADNEAPYYGGGIECCRDNVTIANSVLWGNSSLLGPQCAVLEEQNDDTDTCALTVSYSNVEGGEAAIFVSADSTLIWGSGNIDSDPLFIDPDGDDYHLLPTSPCIDAADNEAVPPDELDLDEDGDTDEPIPFDLDGNPRFIDDLDTEDTGNPDPDYPELPIVDMGAYEFQIPGDLNGDGCVDQGDLGILLADWGCTGGDCPGDLDFDGDTDHADLGILLAHWGQGCP